jgi:choline dehydrogenase-like flavoprotein
MVNLFAYREDRGTAVLEPTTTQPMREDGRVIVIGSGPAGGMAALTLVEQGIPVLMLESGLKYPGGLLVRLFGRNVYRRRPHQREALLVESASSKNADTLWHRALVPGGLSNYWTGAVPRFAPEDFTDGARLDERYRWPVTYDELVPYYKRVESLMGITGTDADYPQLPACSVARVRSLPSVWEEVAGHAKDMGQGLVPLPMADVASSMVTRSGAAFNSFTQIIPRLLAHPHFELRLGAHATHLELGPGSKDVEGVRYVDRSTTTEERVTCAAVVVAAGTIGSTKLLLDSTCPDFPTGIGDSHGVLGRYLHDHSYNWAMIELEKPATRLGHAAYFMREPYGESPPLSAAQSVIGNASNTAAAKLLTFTPLPTNTFGITMFGTTIPQETNYVGRQVDRRDEFGLPAVDIHLGYGEQAIPTLQRARDRLLSVLSASGYPGRFVTPLSPLTPGESIHYVGSVRMHDDPRYGVLDRWNRVRDVDNVLVVDASCFTATVEKNPVLTSMALSARAASHLAASCNT